MPKKDQRARRAAKSADGKPPASEAVSDGLVLAAVARAHRHGSLEGKDAGFWGIIDHLAIAKRTRAARHVRDRLDAMQREGLVRSSRRHGIVVWGLTSAGQGLLERQLRSADPPRLPESPQHRVWRAARSLAAQEIDRLRDMQLAVLVDALDMADSDPPATSDAWFAVAERLRHAAWTLGSATYCLHEWQEPSDDRADIDTCHELNEEKLTDEQRRVRARSAGRRNTSIWQENDYSKTAYY
jgi:hypothetical protein